MTSASLGAAMPGLPSILEDAFRGLIKRDAFNSKDFIDLQPFLKNKTQNTTPPREGRHAAELAKMVEAEIIPRLMLAHRPAQVAPEAIDPETAEGAQGDALGSEATESFARMVLSKDSDSLIAHVGALLQSGIPMETIYVDLMMPAARRLGDYWDDDSISFADVTIGLSRLQQVVRTLGWKQPHPNGPDHSSPSALFVPVSTEQHTFGLFIIEDFFRRAGWRTWIETSGLEDDAVEMVRHHWFDLIGLSASRDAQTEEIASTIAAIRKASRNPGLFILVGGRLFIDRPELVLEVGADATAPNGSDALLVANKAVRRLASNA
jgi:methanogenic corrinoid protein MtbC1